jgi:hypothetical protein
MASVAGRASRLTEGESARGEKWLSGVKSASASRHAGARAHAGFEGIHGRAGGSGVAVTASETVMFFVKGFKCSRVQLTC